MPFHCNLETTSLNEFYEETYDQPNQCCLWEVRIGYNIMTLLRPMRDLDIDPCRDQDFIPLTSTLTPSNSQLLTTEVISGAGAKVDLPQPVPENYNEYFVQADVDTKVHIFSHFSTVELPTTWVSLFLMMCRCLLFMTDFLLTTYSQYF